MSLLVPPWYCRRERCHLEFLQVRTEAPMTQAACENHHNLFQRFRRMLSSTRIPVSQGESLDHLAVTVESAPASAYHLLASAIQISHSVSRNENKGFSLKVSGREHRCLFRVVSAWRLSCDCGVTRSKSSLASEQFVKHALGCLDHTLVCLRRTSRF